MSTQKASVELCESSRQTSTDLGWRHPASGIKQSPAGHPAVRSSQHTNSLSRPSMLQVRVTSIRHGCSAPSRADHFNLDSEAFSMSFTQFELSHRPSELKSLVEIQHVLHKDIRLLQGCKVPSLLVLPPLLQVVAGSCPRLGQHVQLLGEARGCCGSLHTEQPGSDKGLLMPGRMPTANAHRCAAQLQELPARRQAVDWEQFPHGKAAVLNQLSQAEPCRHLTRCSTRHGSRLHPQDATTGLQLSLQLEPSAECGISHSQGLTMLVKLQVLAATRPVPGPCLAVELPEGVLPLSEGLIVQPTAASDAP